MRVFEGLGWHSQEVFDVLLLWKDPLALELLQKCVIHFYKQCWPKNLFFCSCGNLLPWWSKLWMHLINTVLLAFGLKKEYRAFRVWIGWGDSMVVGGAQSPALGKHKLVYGHWSGHKTFWQTNEDTKPPSEPELLCVCPFWDAVFCFSLS